MNIYDDYDGTEKNVMSTSMYNWNQHRTTVDNPLVHRQESRRGKYDSEMVLTFCTRFLCRDCVAAWRRFLRICKA